MSLVTTTSPESHMSAENVRRLADAQKYVLRSWFPVNPKIFKDFKERLLSGHYDKEPHRLYEDMRMDSALMTLILSKVGASASAQEKQCEPTDFLKQLAPDRVRALVHSIEEHVSTHHFEDSKDFHIKRLRHAVISTATAEAMATRSALDPSMVALCATIRQVGLNLVAWNYPTTYHKALNVITEEGGSLERQLIKLLGFSPLSLGAKLCLDWSGHHELISAISHLDQDPKESRDEPVETPAMTKFCEVGEALGRLDDPETYPHEQARAEHTQDAIIKVLGRHGLAIISEEIKQRYNGYVPLFPKIYPTDVSPDYQRRKANQARSAVLFSKNSFIKHCTVEAQDKFRRAYEEINPGNVSIPGLAVLVREIVPLMGFISGCVYLIDPVKMMLMPKLKLGTTEGRTFKPISCSCGGTRSHPVSEAFHTSMPIRQDRAFVNGDVVSHLTGRFGNQDKTGILYLEMGHELEQLDNGKTLIYFKAIRSCMADCLALSEFK